MAVGARITSNNLSGKTATVTFTPYTGSTSGTTENLGTKTIPFNNINTHPYGDYNLYFAEYDYTYTLNVPEPVTDSQLYVYVSKMVNDNNWGAATLNFNDFTATVIDLNVDTNEYYINDLHPLTNSGFGYHFQGENNSGYHVVIFTDASNTEIGRYTTPTPTNDTEFNDLDGRWSTFIDFDLGVFKYSNGVDVYTYEYDGSRYGFDIQWDYDSTMSDTSFIVIKYDNQGTDHHALKFNADGTQTTLKSWTDNDYVYYNFQLQFSNDIFVVEKINPGGYEQLEICGLDGTVLETISLTGATYNDCNRGFYGTNKYFSMFYNNSDVNTAYKIISYNFNTTTLIETSHPRGTEYQNMDWRSDSHFWPNEYLSENLMISLYNNTNNWTNWGYEVNFMDTMYIFGNQSSFTTFTFANDETKFIYPWLDQTGSNMFRGKCDNGDGIASVLTILSGSTHIESLNIPVSGITSNNYWNIDDRTVYGLYTDQDYTGYTMTLIGVTGGTQDTKSLTFNNPYGDDESRSQYKTFYFGANTVANGNEGWYINDNTTGFTSTGYYYWQSSCDEFYTPTFLENSDIVLYHYGDNVARVLTATGISQEFSLSAWNNNKNIEVGDNMFMHIYDDGNNYYHVKLYDFEGTLLNTLDTTFTSLDESYAAKDRFVVRFYNNDTEKYVMYMISADNIASVQLDDYNTYDTANDYIWWDD
jgi:hypothetical protein